MNKTKRRKQKRFRRHRRDAANKSWERASMPQFNLHNIPNAPPLAQWFYEHQQLQRFYEHQQQLQQQLQQLKQLQQLYCYCYGVKKAMNIAVIQEDGTENEFEVELCCPDCARKTYGWSPEQYNKVFKMQTESQPIKIPDGVTTAERFKEFVKTL